MPVTRSRRCHPPLHHSFWEDGRKGARGVPQGGRQDPDQPEWRECNSAILLLFELLNCHGSSPTECGSWYTCVRPPARAVLPSVGREASRLERGSWTSLPSRSARGHEPAALLLRLWDFGLSSRTQPTTGVGVIPARAFQELIMRMKD